jgi:hypothetical protein
LNWLATMIARFRRFEDQAFFASRGFDGHALAVYGRMDRMFQQRRCGCGTIYNPTGTAGLSSWLTCGRCRREADNAGSKIIPFRRAASG